MVDAVSQDILALSAILFTKSVITATYIDLIRPEPTQRAVAREQRSGLDANQTEMVRWQGNRGTVNA